MKDIHGWLTDDEGRFLYDNARNVSNNHVIVEIGSWKGRSTCCLALGVRNGNDAKIFAIDPHNNSVDSKYYKRFGPVDTYEEYLDNLERSGVGEYVESIRDTSENASKYFNNPIEFIFIDGDHGLNSVYLDLTKWFPKVTEGGILAFHDSWCHLGPHLITGLLLLTSKQVRNPKLIDTITCFEKVVKNSIYNRFENVIFFLYRAIFGLVGYLKLSSSVQKFGDVLFFVFMQLYVLNFPYYLFSQLV